jgi:glucose/arabinose dehydrogenase
VALFAGFVQPQTADPQYVKKDTRADTIVATLKASGLPAFDGAWHWIGPFDNPDESAFDRSYPPEKEIDLSNTYDGRGGKKVSWQPFKNFKLGQVVNLKPLVPKSDFCFVYLYHEMEAKEAVEIPLSLGSDDSIAVWLNGQQIHANNAVRPAAPDQDETTLKLKAGKNHLLIRVGNIAGDFAVYVCPEFPAALETKFGKKLERDFAQKKGGKNPSLIAAEAKHYKLQTVPLPKDVILEVGGLAFRPDGKLLACTRRGEIWLIENPESETKANFKLFATGLHEALGLYVEGKDVYCVQRPELTRIRDIDGDDVADEYTTICDKWGVSGDYHEFAFGPAKDKNGDFYVTLNVGFGGGHQSKTPWRGWCVRISPDGKLHPFATGLRSPNGINFSPEGDLFYCDNQGEWVCTNKMHHLKPGEFYGHQAGLRWVDQSPFAGKLPSNKAPNGMRYDGQAGPNGVAGMPPHTPPCIWFPYGRMGQSASEPRWDTTGGKFGPFAGQCFVGDQTKSNVMRVYLEKVNGLYQGACFPFRSGGQCGINRIVFGPDGSMYIGQTDRGWGSLGGKTYGLQRIAYTGVEPLEMHSIKLTKDGFDLVFTKPLDATTAEKLANYSITSFTYYYWPKYGCDEIDRKAEAINKVHVHKDGKTVSLTVPNRHVGRVYEVRLDGIRSQAGDAVLHPEGYYTLNQLP